MNVATFPPPSLQAQVNELRREKMMRGRVYPHWIATGKITQAVADHNNRGLEGAIATLERLSVLIGALRKAMPELGEVLAARIDALGKEPLTPDQSANLELFVAKLRVPL